MEREHALYIALCVAILGFPLAFGYPAHVETRVLWYYPIEHRWAFEVQPTGLAMDWYGRTLLATAVAIAAFFGVYGLSRRWKIVRERSFKMWAAWAITVTFLVMTFYAWNLYSRRPTPAPLPSWYVPK